jgi:glycosyltransferase involved in cell wall biosynthesis
MIDFIIPHMGRIELLTETINSILAQTSELVGQIIVVTKNATNAGLPEHKKVKILRAAPTVSISEQRNMGVEQSTSDIIAFLDADIGLAPDWLSTCHNLLISNPNYAVVSAMQHCADISNSVELLRTTLSNAATEQTVDFLPGRNLLTYRRYHDAIGGFPTHLATCEDYYYTDKIQQFGKLYYTAKTYYYHLGEDASLRQTFAKEIWRSEYNLYSVKGRTISLREWPSILLPFWLLAAGLITILGLHWPVLALLGLIALAAPVSAYALRLIRIKPPELSAGFSFIFYSVYFAARTLGTLKGVQHLWLGKTRSDD